ncbi:phospho-acceptor domain-containing protein [Ulvibacter sp. MAR_2010_11]|uniref:GAF domain-containing sensor histidine kinase n=1 Tax=Ulvibacter sp. MAR_2010_11 TaxID=1250229 RepID=UPI000C2B5635|nr:GAF domain-containing sensor histidine kinase [Ulvibacter sp. MAR_2010_11]PKA82625.1 phospho-acceptor domain-containing protein [Ulvibacter sp. MAR_2010_11]
MNDPESLNIQIQNRLVEQLTIKNSELTLINSFSQALHHVLNTIDVTNLLIEKFNIYFGNQWCEIYLMDEEKEHLIRVNTDSETISNSDVVCCGVGLIGIVGVNGKAKILVGNNEGINSQDSAATLSEIAVPLVHNGKDVVGVIYSKHEELDFFDHNQLKTIETMASIAASKILQIENLTKIKNYQTLLEEYVHIVSHDLKSPLRSINALISWIQEDNEGKLSQETSKNFDLIDDTLFQMDNLITNTLNYSRMDYDVFEEERVNLNDLIQDIENTLQFGEYITFIKPDQLPTIKGNRTKFMQIFQNLIENAIKYIDKTEGLITIDFTSNVEFYTFSIQDNGVGIKEIYFEKIFQIFQTLDDKKESSGIGLSIVKKLVNNYGGKIWLQSNIGLGTTFFFTIKKHQSP